MEGLKLVSGHFRPLLVVAAILVCSAHSPYTRYRTPDGSISCCGGHDCAQAAETRVGPQGNLEVYANGKWWRAMDPLWYVREPSDDGGWHVCMPAHLQRPRCIIGPGWS